MNSIIIFLLLNFIFISLNSQTVESKFNSSSEYINLNGKWDFKFDTNNVGIIEQWQKGNITNNWISIKVPSTYNITFSNKYFYFGYAWYKKKVKITKEQINNNRILLHINGAAFRSDLWVNGRKAGSHISAYTDFVTDITDLINTETKNIFVIRTNNKIERNTIPDRIGWWPYGGLYRDVYLEIVPEVYIENIWMETSKLKNDKWKFSVNYIIKNCTYTKENIELEFLLKNKNKIIWNSSKKFELGNFENHFTSENIIDNVKEWTPDFPKLYELIIKIKNKTQTHKKNIKTAFRQITVKGTRIYLNGKPLIIKGINYHEDAPAYGNAIPNNLTEKDLKEIKDLGVNFIRTAHYTHKQYFYDLCDKMGFLVWSEVPVWQSSTKLLADNQIWKTYLKPQLNDMVMQYRQHPSIVVWSIGNEFSSDENKALLYVKKSIAYVRSLDSTRLLTFASNKHRDVNDLCFGEVDFISINEYYGWYYGTLYDIGKTLDKLHEKFPGKPIVVSEFNCGAALDSVSNNNSCAISGKQYTLEYQNKFLTVHLDQIYSPLRRDFVPGGIIWLYNDFADIHRYGSPHQKQWNYVNLKGLVNQKREHKPSFELVKRYYNCLRILKN